MTQALLFETEKPETIPVPGERGNRQALLLPRADVMPPPSEDELGEALLWGSRTAVRTKLLGQPPHGIELEDLASIVAERARRVCSRWRQGGPKTLRDFCYWKCWMELREQMKIFHAAAEDPDALDADGTVRITRRLGEVLPDRQHGESGDDD